MSAGAGGGPEGASAPAQPRPGEVLDFMKFCGQLKQTARTGWVRCGVKDYESVADHSWRMALLPLFFAERPDVDHVRCMKIGLVHDLAEAVVGDITPHCGVSKEEKSRREFEAMKKICATVSGCPKIGQEILGYWEEYEAGETREAKLMKDLDKFEMIMQAEDYEEQQGVDLSQFFESTRGKIKDGVVSSWESELRSRRLARMKDEGGDVKRQKK
jgi:putative hydrolase of HD superfamily